MSIKQGIWAGFLAVFLVLAGVILQSGLLLERFVRESRQHTQQALRLNDTVRELRELTTDMERSARQYLVLRAPALLTNFEQQAERVGVLAQGLAEVDTQPWQSMVGDLRLALAEGQPARIDAAFEAFGVANDRLASDVERWIRTSQATTVQVLEEGKTLLFIQIGIAISVAIAVSLVTILWLVRSLSVLDQAIMRLGEPARSTPISLSGPTDLRRIGTRLEWLRQRLAMLEAERLKMLRHVSHELKTPLASLREGVSLLQEGVVGSLSSAQAEVVGIVYQNAISLQRRIEGLLNLNAMTQAASQLTMTEVGPDQMIARVVAERSLHWQARGITVNIDATTGRVTCDEEKLRVIVDNLLANAIDFSPHGGCIWLRARIAQHQLTIDCEDEGPGVVKDDAERIFLPFVQGRHLASEPRTGGSGVGLSIVQELVVALGGQVKLVETQPPQGAHFRVEIPDAKHT